MNTDVIVIGAGAAGLAAAGELGRQGWRVIVLEARDRIGGRILSSGRDDWPQGVELGAEFIHGGSRSLRALLRRAGVRPRPVETNMWWHENGRLKLVPDYWERIRRVAGRIPRLNREWSFMEFLQEERTRLEADDRRLAEIYAAGFNAAPPERLSAHALRAKHAGADSEDCKIHGRYDGLMHVLQRAWPRGRVAVRLNSPVTEIVWRAGEAEVRTRPAGRAEESLRAMAVVITLPLGVLQAGTVHFSPSLKEKEKVIGRMGWGHVVRVLFRFRPGFWSAPFLPEALSAQSGRAFGFVNAPREAVPVWWALLPPAPVLTGWAGGPAAKKLLGRRPVEIQAAALGSLAAIFHVEPAELRRWLADWQMHDWSSDPFARGAYSYTVAGEENAAEKLAEPVAKTLFFAGEATAAETGTVHGALDSGLKAARLAGAALRGRLRNERLVRYPFPNLFPAGSVGFTLD